MIKLLATIFVFLSSIVLPVLTPSVVGAEVYETTEPFASVAIQEVKLGGGTEPKEFVTLYNAGTEDVVMEDWVLEYAKATLQPDLCNEPDWLTASGSTVVRRRLVSGILLPAGNSLVLTYSGFLNDNAAASVRLVEITDDRAVIHDTVGWGETAPCFETEPALLPKNGESIARYLECETGTFFDSNDNAADFYLNAVPGTIDPATAFLPECYGGDTPQDPAETGRCGLVRISELLPNPKGLDSGFEFIELHNPTDAPVPLGGCSLRTSANTKTFAFLETQVLAAGEYRAFYSSETGLTLANAAGGMVELLGFSHETAVEYPGGIKDDHAWVLLNGKWAITNVPSPHATNEPYEEEPVNEVPITTQPASAECPAGKFRNPETNRCKTIVAAAAPAPCKPGQERNPETNRCRSIAGTANTLLPCRPGQERNPATNRCRNTSPAASLVPCKPGQERNPETNRCRKVAGSRTLSACKEGYERNQQTNRCRKVSAASVSPSVGDPASTGAGSKMNYGIIAAVSALIIGYGAYEYRHDIANRIAKVRSSLKNRSSDK